MNNIESFRDKNKEIDYLHDLYLKEKKVVDESKIKDSIKEFFSGKKISDLQIKETSMEKLGKCIIDVNWDFSEDEKICKVISIMVFDKDNLVISNKEGNIRIEKKEWSKRIMKKRINEIVQNPILRSKKIFRRCLPLIVF